MAPNPAAVSGLLRQTVHYHLDNGSYDNALFFAERLAAQDPKSTDAAHLVALSHLRLRDFRSAYDAAKPAGYRGTHLGCAWVFAQACLALERYKDGISALEKSKPHWPQTPAISKHTPTSRAPAPDASAIVCLLGKLYRAFGDKTKAVTCFEEALRLNAFMWDAFTILCDMGITVRVPNIFRPSEHMLHSFDVDTSAQAPPLPEKDHPVEAAAGRRPPARGQVPDMSSDPFGAAPSTDVAANAESDLLGDVSSHNDFMSKIQAARLRLANSGSAAPRGGSETPPTAAGDAPHAPTRRVRTAAHPTAAADHGMEAPPPKMNYRLGTRRTRAEREREEQTRGIADVVYQELDSGTAAPPTAMDRQRPGAAAPAPDRKRTISGYPVSRTAAASSNSAEEAATRRSARLNTFKPSSRANSGATTTMGAATGIGPAGRELKKARPHISRIVRPGSSGSSVGRVVSGNRKPMEQPGVDGDQGETSSGRVREISAPPAPSTTAPSAAAAARTEEALRWVLELLRKLGNGYYQLSRYECEEALQALRTVPAAHQGTAWVLGLMGRAHFEQAAYGEAEKFFRKMRVQAPSRLQDMEVYSTILWHLKRETDLSFLAHELIDGAWNSPQAWCALGNAWSLAREPEQALRCFKRATQLDPGFAYAFTLQGHEHVANEEYERALAAYRMAVAADRRHYNAYYGIGRVQQRLGAYDKAHTHYAAASAINPNNAVLICCIGRVLEKLKQPAAALAAYTRAVDLAPRAAQTRYMKARGLLAVGNVDEAHKELMVLKDLAPDEGTVHFLLGTLYRTVNDRQAAVRHFTIALALDPKVRSCLVILPRYDMATNSDTYRPAPRSRTPSRASRTMRPWRNR